MVDSDAAVARTLGRLVWKPMVSIMLDKRVPHSSVEAMKLLCTEAAA